MENGKWNGKQLILDEKFNWNDGEVQTRQWTIDKIDEHNYEGTAGDVVPGGNHWHGRLQFQAAGRALRVHER